MDANRGRLLVAVALSVIGGGVLIDFDHIPYLMGAVPESMGRFLHLPVLIISVALLSGYTLLGVLRGLRSRYQKIEEEGSEKQ